MKFQELVDWAQSDVGEISTPMKKLLEDTFQLNDVKVKMFLMALMQAKIATIAKMAQHLQIVHERMIDPEMIKQASPKELIAFHNILAGEINNFVANNKPGTPPVSLNVLANGDISVGAQVSDEGRKKLREIVDLLLPKTLLKRVSP